MLVRLYALEPRPDIEARLAAAGTTVRRALAPELGIVAGWIGKKFDAGWVGEASVAFSRQPPACFLAVRNEKLVGFACYDAIARGFFGPTGVDEAARGVGIGHALLLATLLDMRARGYGYAVIGSVGPAEFYARAVGATPIADSTPGIYAGLLKSAD